MSVAGQRSSAATPIWLALVAAFGVLGLLSFRSIGHDHRAALGRLCLDEIERQALVDAVEEPAAFSKNDRMHDEPQLVDQVFVQKAGDEGGAAYDIRILSRPALEGSQVGDAPDNLRGGRP